MIDKISKLLNAIKEIKPYTITLMFIASILYVYRVDFSNALETKVFNKDVVMSSLSNDVAINKSLREFLNDTKSDRAYVFRFHNGIKYYNGTHKNKLSCDYEVVTEGTSREAKNLQDIPVTLYTDMIKTVVDDDFYYSNIDDMDDIVTKSEFRSQGVIGVKIAPYFRDGKLFAMIGVDYVKSVNDVDSFDKDRSIHIKEFKKRTEQIGKLLE